MSLAVLCSGQAGQHAGMFDLTGAAAEAQPVFAAATAAFDGRDPRTFVRSARQAELHANRPAQLRCCTQALAAWAALRPAAAEVVIAGYSVGELAAWGCAGLLDAADVLRLANVRAAAMDAAAPTGTGLAAVRGVTRAASDALCRRCPTQRALINGPDSFVVGGLRPQLLSLCEAAANSGASRSVLLPVGVAAHTAHLAPASERMRAELRATRMSATVPATVRLLSGLDGDAVRDVDGGAAKLAAQISQPLDWQACLEACREAGVATILELGPGRALSNMAREALPEARCRSVEDFRTLAGVRAWLAARL